MEPMDINDLETLKADLSYIQRYAQVLLTTLTANNGLNNDAAKHIRKAMSEIRWAYIAA